MGGILLLMTEGIYVSLITHTHRAKMFATGRLNIHVGFMGPYVSLLWLQMQKWT